jgi:lipopolysaccharide/colanic/teichoic acid biosynthesis glycosyltransferase
MADLEIVQIILFWLLIIEKAICTKLTDKTQIFFQKIVSEYEQ